MVKTTGILSSQNGRAEGINREAKEIASRNINRRKAGVFASLLAAFALQGTASEPVLSEINGLVAVEAEHADTSTAGSGKAANCKWSEASFSSASASRIMTILPNSGLNLGNSTEGPELTYNVTFNTPGTYYVWVRMYGASVRDDSLHVGLNGTPASYSKWGVTDCSETMTWVDHVDESTGEERVTVNVPSAGEHTLNVWMREDGTIFDKIVLSASSSYIPTGNGPKETFIILETNQSPVAADDTAAVNEDASVAVNVLANDTDEDGDTLTVFLTGNPVNGTASVNSDGSISYTPKANYNGTDSFTYTATDPDGATSQATTTITVNPVNDAPTLTGTDTNVEVGETVDVTLAVNDIDGETPTLKIAGKTVSGTTQIISANTVRFTAGAEAETGIITVKAQDAAGAYVTADINVTVTKTETFDETDGLAVIEAEAFHTATAGSGKSAGIEWQIIDNADCSGQKAISPLPNNGVNLGDSTDGPSLTYNVRFQTTGTYHVWVRILGMNNYDDSLHFGLDGSPASFGSLGMTDGSGQHVWLDNVYYSTGNKRVTINVTTTGLHTLNVWMREDGVIFDRILLTTDSNYTPEGFGPVEEPPEPVNEAPVAFSDAVSLDQDTSVTVAVLANDSDPENDTLNVLSATGAANGTVEVLADNTIQYTPDAEYFGNDTFNYTISDTAGNEAGASVSVTVNAVIVEEPTTGSNNGLIVFEAEDFTTKTAGTSAAAACTWETTTGVAGYSGTTAMIVPDAGKVNAVDDLFGPRMDYTIQINQPGIYYFWTRILGANVYDDSIHIGIDGTPFSLGAYGVTDAGGSWAWTSDLNGTRLAWEFTEAGTYTFNVWMREDGVVVDKFILTVNSDYTPSGTGLDADYFSPVVQHTTRNINSNVTYYGTLTSKVFDGMAPEYIVTGLPQRGDFQLLDSTTGAYKYTPFTNQGAVDTISYKVSDGLTESETGTFTLNCVTWNTTTPKLNFSWDEAPENDVVGYRVCYGTASGQYTNFLDAGTSLSQEVPLEPGVTYYIAVCALNEDELESNASEEMTYTYIEGITETVYATDESTIDVGTEVTTITDSSDTTTTTDSTTNTEIPEYTTTSPSITEEVILLEPGWNFVSFALADGTKTAEQIFGDSVTVAWEYDTLAGAYKLPETIEPKVAYWVHAEAQAEIVHTGSLVEDTWVTLKAGWNGVGPLEVTVAATDASPHTIYGWDAVNQANTEAVELLPGNGYWVWADSEYDVNLTP